MTIESWRSVVGWEGLYEVSDRGRVRSLDRVVACKGGKTARKSGRMLKAAKTRNGRYHCVTLQCAPDKPQVETIHRLVLYAFIGPRPEGTEACHNNGKSFDNHRENLRWGTGSENSADKLRHGTLARGSRTGNSKLTEGDIPRIFDLARAGCSQGEIGAWFNTAANNISLVLSRKSWRHVALP